MSRRRSVRTICRSSGAGCERRGIARQRERERAGGPTPTPLKPGRRLGQELCTWYRGPSTAP
jgi:hypothetical protein